LVADDDIDSREPLAELARLWGYEVVEARDGAEAVRLVENEQPAVAVIDLAMPKLNGFQAAQRISALAVSVSRRSQRLHRRHQHLACV
jgi:CheY-like chemotaxis protein